MKRWDILVLAILILCTLVALQYYYNMEMRQCLKEPLQYASIIYEERYNHPFSGQGQFIDIPNSPIIFFDSSGVTAERWGEF